MVSFNALIVWLSLLLCPHPPKYSEKEIIYGRRDGLSLTMTVITPEKSNGKAIVSLLSGGYYSDHSMYASYRDRALTFVDAGYTVFLAAHSSTPRYSIVEALEDVQKAVQFVRFHAADYKIDPGNIGITGTSSGGHLALLVATAPDNMRFDSENTMESTSTRVQAVAVFCAPTDFLNYGEAGVRIRDKTKLLNDVGVTGSFRYKQFNEVDFDYVLVDQKQLVKMDSLFSPVHHVTSDDPPIYICHGTADDIVPFQQAELIEAKLKAEKIPVTIAKKDGKGHGWKNMNADQSAFVTWFDKYLSAEKSKK